MKEIILVASMNYDSGTATKSDGMAKLSINELRSQLYAKGKDFDGPRGMLIAQLEAERNEDQKSSESKQRPIGFGKIATFVKKSEDFSWSIYLLRLRASPL